MIQHRPELQALRCDICGDAVELSRKTASDPEKLLLLVEEMKKSHKSCETYRHDPERARRERQFDQRMQQEIQRVKRRAA